MRSTLRLAGLAASLLLTACLLPGCAEDTNKDKMGAAMEPGRVNADQRGPGVMEKGTMETPAKDKGAMETPAKDKGAMEAAPK